MQLSFAAFFEAQRKRQKVPKGSLWENAREIE